MDGATLEALMREPEEDLGGDGFVLPPSGAPRAREDRPPPPLSVARLVLTLAVTTAVLVAVAWLIGLLVKLQLDRYFRPGG
jgi:hypothetical protein